MTLDDLLVVWAAKYEVDTILERIVGQGPSACDPLATRGKRVIVARDDGALETSTLDLVVVHGEEPHSDSSESWRDWLASLARRASKLVVLEAPNPGPASFLARLMKDREAEARWGRTATLAPVLWELGRVRDHVFLGVPEGASRAKAARSARRHAFVIDVTPRTPQARRKVRLGLA